MLLATVCLWALNFTVSKYILDHGSHPLAYSSIRYACAGLIFAGITLAWEGSLRIARRDLPIVVFCTAVLFGNQLSFVYALRFTTATTVALIFGTLPIFTALFARGSGVEHLPLRFWIAAGLSFAGVALVALGSGGNVSSNLKGDLLALSGSATWAAYSVAIGPLMRRYSPFRLSAVFLLTATVALFVAGSRQLADQSFHFGALVWIGFAFAVLGPLVITNLLCSRPSTASAHRGRRCSPTCSRSSPPSSRSRSCRSRSPPCRSWAARRSRAESCWRRGSGRSS